jgi:membrane dipeptidase
MQLTYSRRNLVGDGCNEPTNVGLSLFGRELVQEMNRCGILVDLSHAGTLTALEAIEVSTQPVIISHASVHKLHPNPRNISDELIDAVADSGGVIGLTTFAKLNWDGDPSHPPAFEEYLKAVDYVVQRVGIEHVGIGTDSEATEGAYPQSVRNEIARSFSSRSNPYTDAFGTDAPDQVAGLRGLRDFPLITEALLQRGYQSEDVAKVLGGNFLRVYEAVWPR